MKAYTDLAEEIGQSPNESVRISGSSYVSKVRGHGNRRVSPGAGRHFGTDYTGRAHLATRRLSKTVTEGSYDQITQLLSNGANPRTNDVKGRTPLHFAAVRGHVDIVQTLISHGAVVNEQDNIGNTPLHLACIGGHVGVVTALLRAGTNVTTTDTRGSTPLHLALSRLRTFDSRSQLKQATPTNHRKREVEKIIDMIREYLRVGGSGHPAPWCCHGNSTNDGISNGGVEELDSLASRLTLSENDQQVDEISSLLLNFTELSIHKQSNPSSSS